MTIKDMASGAAEKVSRAVDVVKHRKAPVLEAIESYHGRGMQPYSMPAHKAGHNLPDPFREAIGDGAFRADVEMMNGLDDRTASQGIQDETEDLAADLMGADDAMVSLNGSSLGVQAAVLAATGEGGKLIVARNSHKSVFAGII